MKKLLIPFLAATFLFGCDVKDEAASLAEDAQNSYNNLVDEAGNVVETFNETKAKIEETAQDIENAANAIKAAKDAVTEITE